MQKYSNRKKDLVSLIKTKKTFLIAIASVATITIGISIFAPNFKTRPKFQMPEQVTLLGLNFKSSRELGKPKDTSKTSSTRQYIYTFTDGSPNQELRIDAAYILASASVPSSLSVLSIRYSNNRNKLDNLETKQIKDIGYVTLFTHEQRAYLASCINPRGGSTVTLEQFNKNRNKYDITPERIARYLIGVIDLRDDRCILTAMSIALDSKVTPQNKETLEPIYQKLQSSWSNWFANWQANFPES